MPLNSSPNPLQPHLHLRPPLRCTLPCPPPASGAPPSVHLPQAHLPAPQLPHTKSHLSQLLWANEAVAVGVKPVERGLDAVLSLQLAFVDGGGQELLYTSTSRTIQRACYSIVGGSTEALLAMGDGDSQELLHAFEGTLYQVCHNRTALRKAVHAPPRRTVAAREHSPWIGRAGWVAAGQTDLPRC